MIHTYLPHSQRDTDANLGLIVLGVLIRSLIM